VTLQSSSHVEGDIFHQSLAIEQGTYFEGKSRRSEDPLADAKSSAKVKSELGISGNSLSDSASGDKPFKSQRAGE
jgi:cytoskeletal protein CcmA (bactofilin family)